MADSGIPALPSATTLAGSEELHVVQGGNSRKTTTGSFYIPGGTDVAVTDGGTGASDASGARTNLGLVIGTNVQAYNAGLADIAGLAKTDGNIIVGNGTNWVAESGATARASLGVAIGTDVQAHNSQLDEISALTTTSYGRSFLTYADEDAFKAAVNLEIGTDVQAHSALLDDIAGLTLAAGDVFYYNGTNIVNLGIGAEGEVLKSTSGLPAWGAAAGGGDMLASIYDPTAKAADAFNQDNMVDGTVNKNFTATEQTKLAGIETGADVTDATSVAAAGAVMETDTSTASMQFVIDEDDMASDSATKVPTQQSVKAYIGDSTAWASSAAVVRKVGEKLNLDLPSTGDTGHSPDATASYNDGALQAAIDGMLAETYGGKLTIPRGRFPHSAQINLAKAGKRVILQGHGEATQLYFPATANMNALYIGSAIAGGGSGWILRDFTIISDTDGYVTGVYLENANSTRVENVRFQTIKEAIVSDASFGLRVQNCSALSLGGDFFRAPNRTHGNLFLGNSVFTIGGWLANFEDSLANINNVFLGNDTEVCGGILKSAGSLYAFVYDANYMEQASVAIFSFGAASYGSIRGNTLQMSADTSMANFHGAFEANHCFDQVFTWPSTSTPRLRDNIATGTGSIGQAYRTFTPVLQGSTTAGAGTYSTQSGTYTKVQDRIFFDISLTWTAHTGTGNIVISGLPETNTGNTTPCFIRASNLTYSGDLVAAVNANDSTVTVQSQTSGGTLAQVAMDTAGTITISGQYRAAI